MSLAEIAGYKSVALSQVIAADQALWQLVAQETRGQVMTSGDPRPVDKAVKEFMDAPEVEGGHKVIARSYITGEA